MSGVLKPENIADAIVQVQPAGVDISSGVETSPGVKDASRMAALFESIARGRTLALEAKAER